MTATDLKVTTPSDTEVTITRAFNAPPRLVWDAWTKPDLVRQWMFGFDGWTLDVCDMDLRAGGKWRYVWRHKQDGTEMAMGGEYREVTPVERIVHTERWGPEWPETLNTLELIDHGDSTTTVHTMKFPDRAARDAALKTGANDGMALSYDRLETLLRTLSA